MAKQSKSKAKARDSGSLVEIYSDKRVKEFIEPARLSSAEGSKIRKKIKKAAASAKGK